MSPFGKLFWGFLIVFIDIRINGFDLLVDLAGYVLVVIGLAELGTRNRKFARARTYASVLLGLSVLDLFTRGEAGSRIVLFGSSAVTAAFFILLLVVNLMLIYLICKGIAELATAAKAPDLADLAMSRWVAFLITFITSNVLIIAASSDADLGLLALVSIVASLVASLLLAGLLRRADKTLYPRGV